VDIIGSLTAVATALPNVPEESIESVLVSIDSLVSFAGDANRPQVATLLRDAAARCSDASRGERLMRAADAVESGNPIALTPDGLTWKEAAAAQTVSIEDWKEPPEPEPIEESEEPPAALPHLEVAHFFPGLIVRIAQDFTDAEGRTVQAGRILHFEKYNRKERYGGYRLSFAGCTVVLTKDTPGHEAILENANNAWFQPVPELACLQDLWEAIDEGFTKADEAGEVDSDEMEDIRYDLEECEVWLHNEEDRGPAPVCSTGPLAARVFGAESALATRIRLLYAAIGVCIV